MSINYNKGILYVKKRSVPELLTLFLFIFPFIQSFLIELLRLPSALTYSVDFAGAAVLLIMLLRRNVIFSRKTIPFVVLTGGTFLLLLIVYLLNFQSPFYFLWGARNNFRVYVAFLAFATFFDSDDAESCMKALDVLCWINVAVTLFQYFVLGYEQDYLGGIFGAERGSNAYSVIFFSLIISKSLLSYMNGDENALPCFLKCGVILAISAMAELKFFLLFFVIILLASSLLTKFSWRKFMMLLCMAILITLAGSILTAVFGENERLTLDRIIQLVTAQNYATSEDLGRLTAIPTISNNYLVNIWQKLFGMGLGNCDTSSFEICNTPFYMSHANLHYSWFSSAMLFIETGYVGLFLNLMFFVMTAVISYRYMKRGESNRLYCQTSIKT